MRQFFHVHLVSLFVLCATVVAAADGPTVEDYEAAAALLEGNTAELVKNSGVSPHWVGDGGRFWYRRDAGEGYQYVVVDPKTGKKTPAFDHDKLAAALGEVIGGDTEPTADKLGVQNVTLSEDLVTLTGMAGIQAVSCDLAAMECAVSAQAVVDRVLLSSPDGRWAAFARADNLFVKEVQTGELKNAITTGGWMVLDIHGVDDMKREIYHAGGGREPGRDLHCRHRHRVSVMIS